MFVASAPQSQYLELVSDGLMGYTVGVNLGSNWNSRVVAGVAALISEGLLKLMNEVSVPSEKCTLSFRDSKVNLRSILLS